VTGAALLTGVGVGLFIDEVGKFITADNDCFFPAAAPIAYAVFLLAVLAYLQVRGSRADDPRTQLHAALELLPDALDRGLTERDRAELERRLSDAAAHPDAGRLQPLAQALLETTRPGVLPRASPAGVRWPGSRRPPGRGSSARATSGCAPTSPAGREDGSGSGSCASAARAVRRRGACYGRPATRSRTGFLMPL